jgi:hypothetical protein
VNFTEFYLIVHGSFKFKINKHVFVTTLSFIPTANEGVRKANMHK